MGNFISNFLNSMKLGDDYDDDFDDDYLDDDYDDEDEYVEKKSLKSRFTKKTSKYDDFNDEDDDSYSKSTYSKSSNNKGSNNKITQIRQNAPSKSSDNGVCISKPTSIDDGREVCEKLLSGYTVILNLEGLDLEVGQRIIDFTSGAAYAMDGNLQKISNFIFLVTPRNVEISGDLQDILNNSFDVSSMRPRY